MLTVTITIVCTLVAITINNSVANWKKPGDHENTPGYITRSIMGWINLAFCLFYVSLYTITWGGLRKAIQKDGYRYIEVFKKHMDYKWNKS